MPTPRRRLRADGGSAITASLAALYDQLELPDGYPADAVAEAESAVRSVSTDPATAGLADLRNIEFLTIDPAGSMDLDQALHLERNDTGGVLHYAIADVGAFVADGGALDAETRRRGETLYAPDRRFPLHPDVLGQDAASLLPEKDRRAYVWRFELDEGARPVSTTLTRGVIRSRQRWSYVEAQSAVDGGTAPDSIAALAWFGAARQERERERGGASLNSPDIEIVQDGDVFRLERRPTLAVEEWNAQVSLLTGMAAAEIMTAGRLGILRTLPPASDEDVAAFRAQSTALGRPWPTDQSYGDFLRGLSGTDPVDLAVREAAASLFRGAGYVAFDGELPDLLDQAAIGAPYAHTTAPIRRLVDRFVLVVCTALANGEPVPAWVRSALPELRGLMAGGDRLSGQLNSQALDRVEAAVLAGREGEEFDAIVLARRDDGAKVQLVEPPITARVDGLSAPAGSAVRLRLLRSDVRAGLTQFEPAPTD